MTMFLALIVEITIFSFYNFTHTEFSNALLIFSVYIAFSYLIVTLFFALKTFFPNKNRHNINPNDMLNSVHEDYRYIIKGCRMPQGEYFHALQYVFYFLYAIIMLVFHNKPKYAIVINFILMILWLLFFIFKRPAINEFLNWAQIFTHSLLVLMLLMLTIMICGKFNQ